MRMSLSSPSHVRDQLSLAQHRANGKSTRRVGEQVVQRGVQDGAAVEPVVVHDETGDSVLGCQRRLPAHHLDVRQVVAPELAGLQELVTVVERRGLVDVDPVGEPLAPEGVVLRALVVLRQVEGEHPRGHARSAYAPSAGATARHRPLRGRAPRRSRRCRRSARARGPWSRRGGRPLTRSAPG